mmetsp:Transcript_16728/g.51978  ORF Transcript_16728/g.51978 Transcript_16728/m.51978 type:complete len:321 (+) Transcript_16728:1330-2292(+)
MCSSASASALCSSGAVMKPSPLVSIAAKALSISVVRVRTSSATAIANSCVLIAPRAASLAPTMANGTPSSATKLSISSGVTIPSLSASTPATSAASAAFSPRAAASAALAVTCLRCAVRRERRGTDDTARCCCACTALPADSRAAAAIRGGGAGAGRRAPGGRSQGAGFRAFGLGLAKRPARRRCHQVAHGAQCVAVAQHTVSIVHRGECGWWLLSAPVGVCLRRNVGANPSLSQPPSVALGGGVGGGSAQGELCGVASAVGACMRPRVPAIALAAAAEAAAAEAAAAAGREGKGRSSVAGARAHTQRAQGHHPGPHIGR